MYYFSVNVGRLDTNITILKTYLDEEHLLSVLEGLKEESDSEGALQKVVRKKPDQKAIFSDIREYSSQTLIIR